MKVYIARHGQVPHNALMQYNTADEDLTELGIKQAEELRDKIKDMSFDRVISSPLIRAKHTASIITENKYDIILDDRLIERDCGDLSGKPLEVTNRDEYWNYNTKIKYGTSEDIKVFFKRIFDFLEELKSKKYSSLLIVAHSGVSRAFDGYFNGINNGKFINRGIKNCQMKEYEL